MGLTGNKNTCRLCRRGIKNIQFGLRYAISIGYSGANIASSYLTMLTSKVSAITIGGNKL